MADLNVGNMVGWQHFIEISKATKVALHKRTILTRVHSLSLSKSQRGSEGGRNGTRVNSFRRDTTEKKREREK